VTEAADGRDAPGWIDLAAAYNVRDLGGLPAGGQRVRRFALVRGDNPDGLTDADIATLRDVVGLRSVLDLRTAAEVPGDIGAIATAGIERLHIPLIDLSGTQSGSMLLAELVSDGAAAYRRMLAAAAPRMPRIIAFLLGQDRSPALIHCAAGKDRTGIVVAVLLAAAGVDREAIVADYLATAERLATVRASLARGGRYPAVDAAGRNPRMSGRDIEAVLAVLDAADGGAQGYLRGLGCPQRDLVRWRELLLEPAP
jgi:protein tyrosine/serine phosphatase